MGTFRFVVGAALVVMTLGSPARGEDAALAVKNEDTIQTVLRTHSGKPVTLRLGSGEEVGGTVKTVGLHVVHLTELSGKEFFDAVVPLDRIDAVVVRVRSR